MQHERLLVWLDYKPLSIEPGGAWWAAVCGIAKSRTRLSDFTFTFHFHALEKEMATHSSVLAWRIPGMGEPGGLPSMGSHRVGHDWSDLAAAAAARHPMIFLCSCIFLQHCLLLTSLLLMLLQLHWLSPCYKNSPTLFQPQVFSVSTDCNSFITRA